MSESGCVHGSTPEVKGGKLPPGNAPTCNLAGAVFPEERASKDNLQKIRTKILDRLSILARPRDVPARDLLRKGTFLEKETSMQYLLLIYEAESEWNAIGEARIWTRLWLSPPAYPRCAQDPSRCGQLSCGNLL